MSTTRPNPRVVRTRGRVLAAVRELLATRGVEGLSIDRVAKHAGVSRTTIYRHWVGVAEMVAEAAATAAAEGVAVTHVGVLRSDLIAIYGQLAARLSNPNRGAELTAFLAAADRDPAVRETYRAFVHRQRQDVQTVLAAAIASGELPADTDLELAVDLLAAPAFYRRLVMGEPSDTPGYIERVVDTVLAGLGRR
ncbi:MAG: TetR/AcrR family transcriptional regulator [Nocardioides sp.]